MCRTGKTQTAVNIAGCKLQNGSRVLVTSANPQSLAAFVEKLPPDIRKFCIDMAGVERPDGGMSKLCKECECMQDHFGDLAKNSEMYKREVQVSAGLVAAIAVGRIFLDAIPLTFGYRLTT